MWFDFALLSRLIRSSRAGNTANSGCVDDYFRRARESDSLFADGWFLGSLRQTRFTWSGNITVARAIHSLVSAWRTLARLRQHLLLTCFYSGGRSCSRYGALLRSPWFFVIAMNFIFLFFFRFFVFLLVSTSTEWIARNIAWYRVLSRHETRRGVALSLAEFFPPMQIFMWRNVERSQSHSSGICTLFERANKYHDPAQLFSPQRCLRNSETDRPRNY